MKNSKTTLEEDLRKSSLKLFFRDSKFPRNVKEEFSSSNLKLKINLDNTQTVSIHSTLWVFETDNLPRWSFKRFYILSRTKPLRKTRLKVSVLKFQFEN